MVVVGPGEVEAEGVGRVLSGGGVEQLTQFQLPFGRVLLLTEHHVEPVAEGVTTAGTGVERGERRHVQGAGAVLLLGHGTGAVLRREVLEEGLHHVPGRHFTPAQTGLHALGIALPEHPAPTAALVEARQQSIEVVRELPHLSGELIHSHAPTPARPECSDP